MTRKNSIESIVDALTEFESKIENNNAIHFFDIDTVSEDFICGLMNRIYGWSLTNLNSTIQQNYPGIDLGSASDGIAVQVTADCSRDKIQRTLDIFIDRQYNAVYSRLIIVVIGQKKKFRKPFNVDSSINFDYQRDIFDIKDLLKEIQTIPDTHRIEDISQYTLYELGSINRDNQPELYLIEQEWKSVRASCIAKMTTLDINRDVAEKLLNDDINGDKYKYIVDSGAVFLTGEYGIGKSHAIYVMYLKRYDEFIQDKSRPIPRFATIREIVKCGGIEAWAGKEWLDTNRCILFLDGLDEVEYQEINRISEEIAYLTERYSECKVVIGTRPLSILNENKCIAMKKLNDTE